jgi:AcrR family transcriptional regulator
VPAPFSSAERESMRRKLLELGARLFVEYGRDGLSMRKLAAEFGFASTMALYRWFKNKEELVLALRIDGFRRLGHAMEKAYKRPGTVRERHSAVIGAYLAFAKNNPNFYRVLFDTPLDKATASPELLEALDCLSWPMKAHADLVAQENLVVENLDTFATQMWSSLHGAILLDNVGLFPLGDIMTMQEATIDALIKQYSPVRKRKARARRSGLRR